MATSIVSIIASILSYLSAKGIDSILGKWAASFSIAWEKTKNDAMSKSFDEHMAKLQEELPKKYKAWESWRK